jgi:hypothetical protein
MTDRRQGFTLALSGALLAPFLVIAAACGGAGYARQSETPEEATGADAAGGEAESEEETTSAGTEAVEPEGLGLAAEDQAVVSGYGPDMQSYESDFSRALELGTPNCDRAGELRDAICDLADRICNIADRNTHDDEVRGKCDDGRGRCERARSSVDDRCG